MLIYQRVIPSPVHIKQPQIWSPKNVEIPNQKPWFRCSGGVFHVNGGGDWFNEMLKLYITKISKQWILHWIGFVGKILTGNPSVFTIKLIGLSCKFSHHPILWYSWFFVEQKTKLSTDKASIRLAYETLPFRREVRLLGPNTAAETMPLGAPGRRGSSRCSNV